MRAVPPSRYVVFASIAAVGCTVDLWTKSLVFRWLGAPPLPTRPWWIWEGVFGFETVLNRGALFGIGQGQVQLLVALSIVAALGILIWLFYYGAAQHWLLTIALGAVMAGILGNLYDRLGLWAPPGTPPENAHAVRDWILFEFRGRTWPNFNIADSLLVSGAVMLFWHSFRNDAPRKEAVDGRER